MEILIIRYILFDIFSLVKLSLILLPLLSLATFRKLSSIWFYLYCAKSQQQLSHCALHGYIKTTMQRKSPTLEDKDPDRVLIYFKA